MTERELDGDEDEDSDPGEDGADDEPSLRSHEIRPGGAVSYLQHYVSDGCEMLADCEMEHDGREPEEDGEPSLGSLDRQMDQRLTMQASGFAWSVTDGEG